MSESKTNNCLAYCKYHLAVYDAPHLFGRKRHVMQPVAIKITTGDFALAAGHRRRALPEVDPIGDRAVTHPVADLVQGIEATQKGTLLRIKRRGGLPLRNRDTGVALECAVALLVAVQIREWRGQGICWRVPRGAGVGRRTTL